ncbi:MAG: sulfotransferase family 2 domain-containing protein [Devosia sp.]
MSISSALFGRECGHIPYFEYQRANPGKFRRYFKFAFVRNPWDRLVSTYFYLRKGGANEMDRRWAEANLGSYSTFDEFVRDWVTEKNVALSFPHFRSQHYFVADTSGRLVVDFLGRFETLAADFQAVAARLGVHPTLPVLNRTERGHYEGYYDAATRQIVAGVYAKDIDLFGYRF